MALIQIASNGSTSTRDELIETKKEVSSSMKSNSSHSRVDETTAATLGSKYVKIDMLSKMTNRLGCSR